MKRTENLIVGSWNDYAFFFGEELFFQVANGKFSGSVTPLIHWFSAIYRGHITPQGSDYRVPLMGVWMFLVDLELITTGTEEAQLVKT